jgi:ABC-type bacteriocin/lantibiotic exporter with double-glycine peptidase domain
MSLKSLRQVDSTDCGPTCLAMLLSYWGRSEPIYKLRDLSGTTQGGTSFLGLHRAAKKLGVEAKGFSGDIEGLRTLELPVMLHWEHNHYVVLLKLTKTKAQIADPATGKRWLKLGKLEKAWTGNILWLKPGVAFERGNFVGKRGMKGLWSHLAHFKGTGRTFGEIALGTLILSLLGLVSPMLSQILFDQVLTYREATLLPYLLAGIFILAAFQTGFGTVQGYLSGYLSMKLEYRLQLGYLHHLLHLPQKIHETRLVGDLLSRFGDLARVQGILSQLIVGIPAALLTLITSFTLLFLYNVPLALVALINLPLQVLYLSWLSPRLRNISRQQLKKDAEVQSFLLSHLEGIATVKALQAEAWTIRRGKHQISTLMDISWKGFMLNTWGGVIFGLLGSLGSLVTLIFGARQVLNLELSVGQLVAGYGLMQTAVAALSSITGSIEQIQEGVVASDRLLEVIELEPETSEEGKRSLAPLASELRVENLRFSYPSGQSILQDVSFTLRKGSYTALLGGNGSGKSTLCSLLVRLLEPEAGEVFWDGQNLKETSLESLRNRIVYLKQDVPLFYTTFRENLTLGRDVADDTIWQLLEILSMEHLVQRLPEGLETTVGGDSLYKFSSGERQLLGLVRALLSDADVLILDEPTATLDIDKEAKVVELLNNLKGYKTLLIITHRPALLAPADVVLELRGGIVQQTSKLEVSSGESV